jgi:glucuronoarabinoxylan endo-1,4-beta-xylanase
MLKSCSARSGASLLAAAFTVFTVPGTMAQTVAIDPATTYQVIRGFGGHNGAGWIADLTPAQVDTAFGTEPGQIGLTIMRMRIDPSRTAWPTQLPTARLAKAKGVTLFATPWTPPPNMKTSNSIAHGSLIPAYYPDYAAHLLAFADYMRSNGAQLYGISVQNEPDWDPSYEGCQWTSAQFIDFLTSQGPRFGGIKLMAPESLGFRKVLSDPILNDAGAAAQLSIVAGHLYGATPSDYPLARAKGKELWMTEHYTDSTSDANDWTKAMPVAIELHKSMAANYSAYVWWYIRRAYGLMTEDGNVSKRGWIMSQYAKYVRPGYVRIAATEHPDADLSVTAFKGGDGRIVVVAVNAGTSQRRVDLTFAAGAPRTFQRTTTSAGMNEAYAGDYPVIAGSASAYLEPASVSTFVSQPTLADATGSVRIAQSGLAVNRFTGQFSGTVSITNTSGATVGASTLRLVLDGLTSGVTLANKQGDDNGAPWIALPVNEIAPGATVSVTTTFGNPSKGSIAYTPTLQAITF